MCVCLSIYGCIKVCMYLCTYEISMCEYVVGWVLWHTNLCRLFNAKFIFMKIVLFQTIQFSITQFKCKYSLIVKNISISSYSV